MSKTHIEHFIPATFPEALGLRNGENHVSLSVSYDKGGINYFTYKTDPRGYNVTLSAVRHDGFTTAFVIGGRNFGRRFFVASANRFDARKLQALDAALAPHYDAIHALALQADYDGIKAILDGVVTAVFPPKPPQPTSAAASMSAPALS